MDPTRRTLADHLAVLRTRPPGDGVAIVDLDAGTGSARVPAGWPEVVVGVTTRSTPVLHPGREACDVVVAAEDPSIDAILATVAAHPIASRTLVGVLRGAEGRSPEDGLVVESAAYSALQAGPELAAWLATRSPRPPRAVGPPIRLERTGDRLEVTLTRPEVRNALNTAMRDALVDAFALPALDPSILEVHLSGAGPDFCSGGDLDEFGSFPDPATAHLVRLRQSVGGAIAAVAPRVTAHLHGHCAGSGIELPAFAAQVVAAPSTQIWLPELSLGLIPGAGGTVSLPARIGRHRTALLALTGRPIDAATALEWGLVDGLSVGERSIG